MMYFMICYDVFYDVLCPLPLYIISSYIGWDGRAQENLGTLVFLSFFEGIFLTLRAYFFSLSEKIAVSDSWHPDHSQNWKMNNQKHENFSLKPQEEQLEEKEKQKFSVLEKPRVLLSEGGRGAGGITYLTQWGKNFLIVRCIQG